jgi:hypothetical protein
MNVSKLRLVAAALVVGSLGSLAACGGSGGGRPSADKLADAMSGDSSFGSLDKEVVACMAKAFHDSDLSDGFLQALADKKDDYKPSDKDAKAMTSVTTAAAKSCVTFSQDSSDLPSGVPSELESLLPSDLATP